MIAKHPMLSIMRNAEEERMASIERNRNTPREHISNIKDIAYDVARSAYKPFGTHTIKEWNLVAETPTLKLYENEHKHKCVVGIRGTKGSLIGTDWRANYSIPFNGIKNSSRYKQDAEQIRKWKAKFPSHKWYGVGHSLGGALLDAFIDDGLIDSGLSYNPAVQPQHSQSEKNVRIYKQGDPLYGFMGKYAKHNDVLPADNSLLNTIYNYTIGLTLPGQAKKALDAHNLTNFSEYEPDYMEGKE
jgi:hypothetical protein